MQLDAPAPLDLEELTPRPDPPVFLPPRPRTYGDCVDEGYGEKLFPCPWVGCRHHLALFRSPTGEIRVEPAAIPPEALLRHRNNRTEPELEEIDVEQMVETCSIRMGEVGGMTLEQVSNVTKITREGVRLIEKKGAARMKSALKRMGVRESSAEDGVSLQSPRYEAAEEPSWTSGIDDI